jgi:hypothetical protein
VPVFNVEISNRLGVTVILAWRTSTRTGHVELTVPSVAVMRKSVIPAATCKWQLVTLHAPTAVELATLALLVLPLATANQPPADKPPQNRPRELMTAPDEPGTADKLKFAQPSVWQAPAHVP